MFKKCVQIIYYNLNVFNLLAVSDTVICVSISIIWSLAKVLNIMAVP